MQPALVALPRDYDTSPGRFRLAQRIGRDYLTGGPTLHERIWDVLAAVSRDDSPELRHVWRPAPSCFDAEDAPGLVEQVFGAAETERWDAPLIRLPDAGAVRDYLLARFVPPAAAARAAEEVPVPLTVTKRGALVWARA